MLLRVLLLAALLAFTSACNTSLEEVCGERLPKFERELEVAMSTLGSGRQPANQDQRSFFMEPEAGREWERWAEARMREAQDYIDATGHRFELAETREQLSFTVTQLVAFHGYAQRGDSRRMGDSLTRIREHSRKAASAACANQRQRAGT